MPRHKIDHKFHVSTRKQISTAQDHIDMVSSKMRVHGNGTDNPVIKNGGFIKKLGNKLMAKVRKDPDQNNNRTAAPVAALMAVSAANKLDKDLKHNQNAYINPEEKPNLANTLKNKLAGPILDAMAKKGTERKDTNPTDSAFKQSIDKTGMLSHIKSVLLTVIKDGFELAIPISFLMVLFAIVNLV